MTQSFSFSLLLDPSLFIFLAKGERWCQHRLMKTSLSGFHCLPSMRKTRAEHNYYFLLLNLCSCWFVFDTQAVRNPHGIPFVSHTHTEGKNTSADITNICAKKIEFPGMNIEILLETCAKSWSLILWDLFEKTTIICKILQRVNMAFWFALWRLACRWFEQFSQMFVSESRPWDKGSKSEFIPMSRLDLVEPCQSRPQVDYNNPNVNWDNSSWDLRLPPFFASLPKGTKEVTQAQREKWMFGHPKPC